MDQPGSGEHSAPSGWLSIRTVWTAAHRRAWSVTSPASTTRWTAATLMRLRGSAAGNATPGPLGDKEDNHLGDDHEKVRCKRDACAGCMFGRLRCHEWIGNDISNPTDDYYDVTIRTFYSANCDGR